jgi:hypothetical protein
MNDKELFKNKLEKMYSGGKLSTINEKPPPPARKSSTSELFNLERKISIDTDEVPTQQNPILSNNKVDVKQRESGGSSFTGPTPILSNNNIDANSNNNIDPDNNRTIVYVLSCFNCWNK